MFILYNINMSKGLSPDDVAKLLEVANVLLEGLHKASSDDEKRDLLAQWSLMVSAIEGLLLAVYKTPSESERNIALADVQNIIEYLRTLDDVEKIDLNKFTFLAPKTTYEA